MTEFNEAYDHMIGEFEGGYANKKTDKGKMTYKGISRRSFPDWPGWKIIDPLVLASNGNAREINSALFGNDMMESLVKDLYFKEFWTPVAMLPDRLRFKTFDTCVNMGLIPGIKIMQKAVGTVADGKIGPKTLAAAKDSDAVLKKFSEFQANRYREIVAADPDQAVNLKGWLRRAKWIP
jgi:lysozyme family protein